MSITQLREQWATQEREQEAINALSDPAVAKAAIRASAAARHGEYPQYQGYWSGDAWKLGEAADTVTGKGGVLFERGDYVLFRERTADDGEFGEGYAQAYSVRCGWNALLCRSDVYGLEVRHVAGLVRFAGVYV